MKGMTDAKASVVSVVFVAALSIVFGLGDVCLASTTPTDTPTPTCGVPPTPTFRPTQPLQPTVGSAPPINPPPPGEWTFWKAADYPIGYTSQNNPEGTPVWDDYTKEITYPNPYPTPGSVFGPCKEIDFHCIRATDHDGKGVYTIGSGYSWTYPTCAPAPLSAGFPYWTCSQGGFIDTREGEDVTWKSPETGAWVNVCVYDNDWPTPVPTPLPGDEYPYDVMGTRDDPVRQVDCVSIVVATVDLRIDDNPALDQKGIFVNCDDDNTDGVVDKSEPASTTNLDENDLTKLTLSILPTTLDSGWVTLNVIGSGKIKIWKPDGTEKKGTDVTAAGFSWHLDEGERPPSVYWIEGFDASSSEWDVEFTLRLWHGGEMIDIDSVKFTVYDVKEVVWAPIVSSLEDNPAVVPGGGKRLFPGRQVPPTPTPTGTLTPTLTPTPTPFGTPPGTPIATPLAEDRRRVLVRARIEPTVSGKTVYFEAFDVDDPSPDSSPTPVLDNESNGQDNFGSPQAGTLKPKNDYRYLKSESATDSAGWAELDFYVTMRPGDNFRVVASLLSDYKQYIEAKQADTDGSIVLKGGSRPDIQTEYRTEMLTVWRKLWIEFDAMGTPPAGERFGMVEPTPINSESMLKDKLSAFEDRGWANFCLVGGVLNPRGTYAPNEVDHLNPTPVYFEVSNNDSRWIQVMTDFSSDRFNQYGGEVDDENEKCFIPTPYSPEHTPTPFVVNTDDQAWGTPPVPPDTTGRTAIINKLDEYYNKAYIDCLEVDAAWNPRDTFNFNRYLANMLERWNDILVDCPGSPDFWTACVALAYEQGLKQPYPENKPQNCEGGTFYLGDDDPENEGYSEEWVASMYGTTDRESGDPHSLGDRCFIFCETIRDRDYPIATTVAHEIGHQLGLDHAQAEKDLITGEWERPNEEINDGIMGWEANPLPVDCITQKDWHGFNRSHSYPDRLSQENLKWLRESATD